jgi:GH18 family chitinase
VVDATLVTKAGVPNNKIFVGEASYGRSFRMAQPGCWGPTCDFTGSRTQSDANPGRCTKTAGYLAAAEINEIIKYGDGAQTLHDAGSNTDVMLYKGALFSPVLVLSCYLARF